MNKKISDTLRQAIKHDGRSLRAIAKASAVHYSSLSRFANGERGLSLTAVDSVCSTLAMQLRKMKA